MALKTKNPKYRKKKADCDHEKLEWSKLDKNKEERRRAVLKNNVEKNINKILSNIRRGLAPDRLVQTAAAFSSARNIEELNKGDAFENQVAEDTQAKWTSIEFKCPDCGLDGDIDVVTKDGVVKECKASGGGVKRKQYEKVATVAPIIFGSGVSVHIAVPKGQKNVALSHFEDKNAMNEKIQEH